jgi:hypothetical protein
MPPTNIWALIISMILSVVLGFIWYGPLFGKKWMALSGIVMPDPKPSMKVMTKPIILSLIGAFLISFAMSSLMQFRDMYYAGIATPGYISALSFGFFLWLCFIVPVYFNFSGWENKSWTLFFINTGYWLVFFLIVSAVTFAFV